MTAALDHFPVGQEMQVSYPAFTVHLTLVSTTKLSFVIEEGPYAHSETVDIEVSPLGNGVFAISWKEESGVTVVNIQDYDRCEVHSFVTLPDGNFWRMTGPITITRRSHRLSDERPEQNKALVVEAMTALFQRHDAAAVEQCYAPDYVQHNPTIPKGRDALQALVAGLSSDVFYEPGLVIADGDLVAIHGRIRGWAPVPQIVVDLFRVENGKLAEHWDVLQDEVPATAALGHTAMFDPEERAHQRSLTAA
jgi:predicted SnoaL-like aldol condensation-catalyzing enzyme